MFKMKWSETEKASTIHGLKLITKTLLDQTDLFQKKVKNLSHVGTPPTHRQVPIVHMVWMMSVLNKFYCTISLTVKHIWLS